MAQCFFARARRGEMHDEDICELDSVLESCGHAHTDGSRRTRVKGKDWGIIVCTRSIYKYISRVYCVYLEPSEVACYHAR